MANASNLVIVESPSKAKTIGKYLGSDYVVKASMGHIRDLDESGLSIDVKNGVIIEGETKTGKSKRSFYLPVSTANVLRDVKGRFGSVTYVKWEREGDAMARNRGEMLPIMKFLASRLRMPTPVGMEEAGGVSRT